MAVYRPWYQDKKTGERRQSKVWWYDFIVAGRRIRESAKTTRKTLAVAAAEKRRLALERAMAGLPSEQPAERIEDVTSLLDQYEATYGLNHRPKSLLLVRGRAKHLRRLLGGCLLPDLTERRILDYIRQRQAEGASGRTINLEIGTLSRAIGRTWGELWPKLRKLEERRDVGRALTPNEEARLLDAAAKSATPLLYPYLMVLLWTGARADEARTLRWEQVDLEAGKMTIGRSKTAAGAGRRIPMSQSLRATLEHYATWYAQRFGPLKPDWYVFPYCRTKRPVDPERPVGSLRHAWELALERAGVKCRLHDLRHSFCTKLGEAGISESVMLDLMGHVSGAMLRRYSHIRESAREEAIAKLEARLQNVHVKDSPKVGEIEAEGRGVKLLN